MVNEIIINRNWKKKIVDLGIRFNKLVEIHALPKLYKLIENIFDILSNEKSSNRKDAAHLILLIRSTNPELINPYYFEFIDDKCFEILGTQKQFMQSSGFGYGQNMQGHNIYGQQAYHRMRSHESDGRNIIAEKYQRGRAEYDDDYFESDEEYDINPDWVLEVNDLTKKYALGDHSVTALDNVNFHVRQGEFIAVVGPSGSGKTTLINCLGALDFPDSGDIVYNIDGNGTGRDITEMNDMEHKEMRLWRIGFIFQFYNLFPILTAYENIELPTLLAQIPRKESKPRIIELLSLVGLSKRMRHHPTEMSGGEQQRVTVARALVNDPLLILADEPTGELDTETTTQIIRIFLEIRNEGQSILMVTHNKRIAQVADRILTLTDGKIISEHIGGRALHEIW